MPRKALTLPLGHPWFLTIYPKRKKQKGFCFWGIRQFTPFLENFSSACAFSFPHRTRSSFFFWRDAGVWKKCAKFVGVVVYGAFELRYCLEVCFSILRLKKFQLLGSSTLRFLLNKLQCHFSAATAPTLQLFPRFVMQKCSTQKGWVYLSPGPPNSPKCWSEKAGIE